MQIQNHIEQKYLHLTMMKQIQKMHNTNENHIEHKYLHLIMMSARSPPVCSLASALAP